MNVAIVASRSLHIHQFPCGGPRPCPRAHARDTNEGQETTWDAKVTVVKTAGQSNGLDDDNHVCGVHAALQPDEVSGSLDRNIQK